MKRCNLATLTQPPVQKRAIACYIAFKDLLYFSVYSFAKFVPVMTAVGLEAVASASAAAPVAPVALPPAVS